MTKYFDAWFRQSMSMLALLAAVLLALACGGGSDSSAPVATQDLSGVVSDPAIEGATVTLVDDSGVVTDFTATTDSEGKFSITGVPAGDLAGYTFKAAGGTDVETGESFTGLTLEAPAELLESGNVVVSPLTSLVKASMEQGNDFNVAVSEVQTKVGADPKVDPTTNTQAQKAALGVTMLLKMGANIQQIRDSLDDTAGVSKDDLEGITFKESHNHKKNLATMMFDEMEDSDHADVVKGYTEARVQKEIVATSQIDLSSGANMEVIKTNLKNVSDYIHKMNDTSTVVKDDFVKQVLTQQNASITSGDFEDASFDPTTKVPAISGEVNLSYDNSLKEAFYTVANTDTGNDQLLRYNIETDESEVVESDIIASQDKAFIFRGIKLNDKTIVKERKMGLYLDPNQDSETRQTTVYNRDGSTSASEYKFYPNNVLKSFAVTAPFGSVNLFESSQLPQSLIDAGVDKISASFEVHNTVSDFENSYVQLEVYDALADAIKKELEGDKTMAPVIVRTSDAASLQGEWVYTNLDEDGAVNGLLVNFMVPHKTNEDYPTGNANRMRLQWVSADLGVATDISGADGRYYAMGSNDKYVYLAKEESKEIYAFSKVDQTLVALTDVQMPGAFDRSTYFKSPGGHGSSILLSDFSSLAGMVQSVTDGDSTYLAINYDLDRVDAAGNIYFGPTYGVGQKVYKHAQILKLTDASGLKIFDNGDGVDDGDDSDDESPVGHVSLVAVSDGNLIVEYAKTSVTSDFFGHTDVLKPSVEYGAISTESKTSISDLASPIYSLSSGISYLTARRIYPLAIGPYLYIGSWDSTPEEGNKIYKVRRYDLDTLSNEKVFTGRHYFTKKAIRGNGVYDGSIMTWDGSNGSITELTNGVDLGSVDTIVKQAIPNVFTDDQPPLAGIGQVGTLRADKGGYDFFLTAFKSGAEQSLKYIGVSGTWLVE